MKKILAIATTCISLVSLMGCNKTLTPEQRFEAVMKQGQTVTSMECEAETQVEMKMGTFSMEMEADMDIQMSRTADKLEMYLKTETEVMGQDVTGETYYKDGYYYMSMMGDKMKMKMDIDQMLKQAESMQLQQMALSDLDNFNMTEVGENYQFAYSVKPDALAKYMDQASQLMEGSGVEPQQIKITLMNGTLVVDKDHNLLSQKVDMEMETTVEGQTIQMAVTTDCTYKNIGGKVTINFPADLDSYVELEMPEITTSSQAA